MKPAPADVRALLDAFNTGRMDEAEVRAGAMTRAYPGAAVGWQVLGVILTQQGRMKDAVAALERCAAISPDDPQAQNNLGAALRRLDRFGEAEARFRRAVALKPDYAEACNNLGATLHSLGRLAEAETSLRQAIALRSDYYKAYQNLIFTLDMAPSSGTASLQAERRQWAARFSEKSTAPAFANPPDPDRRLRVGYVSADFRQHSASVVFGAMLVAFDPGAFEVFAYSNTSTADDITALFQRSVTHWRVIAGLSDDAAADLIRADGIDILVDLSGHSAGNRLGAFAKRPAPIQITAWGYLTGTGMDAMDVIFSDPVLIPEDEKRFYAEEVRYLPNAISAFFPLAPPEVGELPALSQGGVTFGSFNRICKISDGAFAAWGRVLRAVPGSRFLMKTAEMDGADSRDRVMNIFAGAGIAPERLTLVGRTSWRDHMAAFNRIDIALDPFPHGGGVTTLEGLMMGVPVVTLRWPTIVGRLSATILTAVGLTDWIAETEDDYVEIAVRKARDLRGVSALRRDLRARLTASIVGDNKAYAAAAGREYRALWRAWCTRQS